MKAILHVQLVVGVENTVYQTEAQQLIEKEFPSVASFGIDNYSSTQMVSYALEMVQQTSNVVILVESNSAEESLGSLVRFFNELSRKKPSHVTFILSGSHQVLQRIGQHMKERFVTETSLTKLKATISSALA